MLIKENINLSIIIVNYNLINEIYKCIDSIKKFIINRNYEVIIVDNDSQNNDFEILVEYYLKYKNIKIIKNKSNVGFGTACNIGADNAKGENLLFLNPDTTFEYDLVTKLERTLNENNNYGIIGVKQNNKNSILDYSAGYFPNIFFEILNIIFIGRIIEAFIISLKNKFNAQYYKVDWVMGSFLLMKKNIFKKIEGFDEEYFLFFEELDLCKRLKMNGYEIVYAPHEYINHIGSKGAKKDYSLFTQYFFESKKLFLIKHSPKIKRAMFNFLLFLQIITQILLWIILYPFNNIKSKGKIKGFIKVLMGFFK